MKSYLSMILVFFVALFVYTKLAGPIPFSVTQVTTTKTDTFSVTGEGKATVSPDIAIIQAGVQTQAATVKQAQDQLNKNINAVSEAVKKLGISDKDIQTSNYSVHPNYDYNGGQQKIIGYNATSTLTIKVRDIEKANSVLDAATASGANQVGGISFDVDDKTKAENEARAEAVAEAKKKAVDAAKIAGFRLGRIINYQEGFGGGVPPIAYAERGVTMAKDMANPTQVEPGSQDITVTVTLSYDIE